MSSKSRPAAGFTLLEMLVSLTLLALILSVTLSAFITLNRSSDRLTGMSQDTDALLTLSRFLQQKITLAQPVQWTPAGFDQSPRMLSGNQDQLTWLSVMNPQQPLGGVHYFRLRQQTDQTLSLELLAFSGDAPDWQQAISVELLSGVTSLVLQYRAIEDDDWRDDWQESQALPDFVKIRISQSELDWPDQVIRVLQGGRR